MRLVIADVILGANALRDRLENPFSVQSLLLFGALIILFLALAVGLNIATNKKDEKNPQNIEPFFEDEVLETKKLERTLSVALFAVAVIAVSIAGYYIWEATRQSQMASSFDERSVRRGQALYANAAMPGYNPTESLACANCHGGYDEETGRFANGGTATFTIAPKLDPQTDPACEGDNRFRNPDCIAVTVAWQAPALNTALYKFPIRNAEADNPFKSACSVADKRTNPDCRSQVFDILTYGRPGTPMPAWGVPGGGAENEQAINDLVNFLAAIQLPADEAAQPLRSAAIIKQSKVIEELEVALDEAKDNALANGTEPSRVNQDEGVKTAQTALNAANRELKAIEAKTETQYIREAAIARAEQDVETARKRLEEEAPAGLNKANADFAAAVNAYNAEPTLRNFSNPQDYLNKVEEDQTLIGLEKNLEIAREKGNRREIAKADKALQEFNRIQDIALNYIESRDAVAQAQATLEIFAPASLRNSQVRLEQLRTQSDGQLLFEYNCARCHTKGWSFFTPSDARVPLPAPQGTGGFGPNIAGGNLSKQFPSPLDQISFINSGSRYQAAYGQAGVGSGRMPGYNTVAGRVLTDEQIEAIVDYERNAMSGQGQNSLGVENLGSSIESRD